MFCGKINNDNIFINLEERLLLFSKEEVRWVEGRKRHKNLWRNRCELAWARDSQGPLHELQPKSGRGVCPRNITFFSFFLFGAKDHYLSPYVGFLFFGGYFFFFFCYCTCFRLSLSYYWGMLLQVQHFCRWFIWNLLWLYDNAGLRLYIYTWVYLAFLMTQMNNRCNFIFKCMWLSISFIKNM